MCQKGDVQQIDEENNSCTRGPAKPHLCVPSPDCSFRDFSNKHNVFLDSEIPGENWSFEFRCNMILFN